MHPSIFFRRLHRVMLERKKHRLWIRWLSYISKCIYITFRYLIKLIVECLNNGLFRSFIPGGSPRQVPRKVPGRFFANPKFCPFNIPKSHFLPLFLETLLRLLLLCILSLFRGRKWDKDRKWDIKEDRGPLLKSDSFRRFESNKHF
jgi:hypothetical protein